MPVTPYIDQGWKMKDFTFIALMTVLLLSTSCSKSGDSSNEDISESPQVIGDDQDSDDSLPPTSGLPHAALTFSTNVTKVNFTSDQARKYDEAIEIVRLVVATEEFRSQVLNYRYNGVKQFADNKGRSNAQIYQSILDAAETLQPAKNNRMDLEVELYYENTNTVGYTTTGSKRIWVNTKYFNQYQAHSVAGNLMHEWLHKLGYTHDSSVTAKRPYTVPYAIGSIMSTIGRKFL
jgi:hypothetical protein